MSAKIFCISGPSGVGKGTLVHELLRTDPTLALSVSCTTRPPREGERDGVDYFFVSKEDFEKGIGEDAFVEYDAHFGNYYGTPKAYVEAQLGAGRCILLEIDVSGTAKVKASPYGKDTVSVFIAPPSFEALEERLMGRGSETASQLALRRERVRFELEHAHLYDYTVINDEFARAAEELRAIVETEKNR